MEVRLSPFQSINTNTSEERAFINIILRPLDGGSALEICIMGMESIRSYRCELESGKLSNIGNFRLYLLIAWLMECIVENKIDMEDKTGKIIKRSF